MSEVHTTTTNNDAGQQDLWLRVIPITQTTTFPPTHTLCVGQIRYIKALSLQIHNFCAPRNFSVQKGARYTRVFTMRSRDFTTRGLHNGAAHRTTVPRVSGSCSRGCRELPLPVSPGSLCARPAIPRTVKRTEFLQLHFSLLSKLESGSILRVGCQAVPFNSTPVPSGPFLPIDSFHSFSGRAHAPPPPRYTLPDPRWTFDP